MCCDESYLPFTCFLANQILDQNPERNFDVIIASAEYLNLPASLVSKGAIFVQLNNTEILYKLKTTTLPLSAYYRLLLPNLLGDSYERVLYLDSDMFIEGGDLSLIYNIEMHGCSIAAVRDIQQWTRPNKYIRDFRSANLEGAPYFNSGLVLFDTQKFISENRLEQCIEYGINNPHTLLREDQSLLNIIYHKDWCEVSPLWNWQYASKKPLFSISNPICIAHFVGPKPWSTSGGRCPIRYWTSMEPYIAKHFPEQLKSASSHHGGSVTRFLRLRTEYYFIQSRIKRYVGRFKSLLDSHPVD